MNKLRENYLKLKDHEIFKNRKIIIINSEQSINKVYSNVKKAVSEYIPFNS